MKRVSAYLLLATALRSTAGIACSCAEGERPFLTAAAEARYVVLASVVRYHRPWPWGRYRSMDLKVEEVLRGPAGLKSLVVTGDNGAECRHYVTQFPVGTRWVFAVSEYAKPDDLAISRCSESALFFDGGSVTGSIGTDANGHLFPETVPLAELRARLNAHSAGSNNVSGLLLGIKRGNSLATSSGGFPSERVGMREVERGRDGTRIYGL